MKNHSFILGIYTHFNSLWPAANTLAKINFTVEFSRNFGQKINVVSNPTKLEDFATLAGIVNTTPVELAKVLNIYNENGSFFISPKITNTLINISNSAATPKDLKAAFNHTYKKVPWAVYAAYLSINKMAPDKPLKYKLAFALLFIDKLGCRTLRSSRPIKKDNYETYLTENLDVLESASIPEFFKYLGANKSYTTNKYTMSVAGFEGLKICVTHHKEHNTQGVQ